MGKAHMVHGAGRRADIAQTRGVMPQKMRQPRDAPRLVYRGRRPKAVAEPGHQHLGIIRKPAGDIAVAPATKVGQRRGQFPMI
jgi:hypothetical protein